MMTLGLILALAPGAASAHAQGTNGEETAAWRLEGLQKGFCVHFLVQASAAAEELPKGMRPLPASRVSDLHPAIKSVVEVQPEFAAWTPSNLCLYYFGTVHARGQRIREDDPGKAPMLAFWTVAVADSGSSARRDLALAMVTNSGRLQRSGHLAGLNIKTTRSSVAPVPPDEEGVPSDMDRYRLRIGKTQLTWDGRPAVDSTRPGAAVAWEWRAIGRQGQPMSGKLTLGAEWTRAMIGSLKVEGKDAFGRMLKASPIRFVGPVYQGGAGELRLGR